MATDDEVRAFLGRITGERGHNPVSGQLDPSEHVGYDHLDTAFVLLERLLAAREACTCVHAADSATCEEGAR